MWVRGVCVCVVCVGVCGITSASASVEAVQVVVLRTRSSSWIRYPIPAPPRPAPPRPAPRAQVHPPRRRRRMAGAERMGGGL